MLPLTPKWLEGFLCSIMTCAPVLPLTTTRLKGLLCSITICESVKPSLDPVCCARCAAAVSSLAVQNLLAFTVTHKCSTGLQAQTAVERP